MENVVNKENELNEKIFRVLSLQIRYDESLKGFFVGLQLYQKMFNSSDNISELVASGSQSEQTFLRNMLVDTVEQENALSDLDLMCIFKLYYAKEKEELKNFNSIIVHDQRFKYENYSFDNKILTMNLNEIDLQKWFTSFVFFPIHDDCEAKFTRENFVMHRTAFEIEEEECSPGFLRLLFTKEFQVLVNTVHRFECLTKSKSIHDTILLQKPIILNTKPYFSSIRLLDQFRSYAKRGYCEIPTEDETLFNSEVKDEQYTKYPSHGPAVEVDLGAIDSLQSKRNLPAGSDEPFQTYLDGIDYVPAFRSPHWPKDALQMIKRKPRSGFPTKSLKAKFLLKGCLIVPTSHKLSNNPDIEWRYSFSECETLLCLSWNQIQMYTYQLLKLLKFKYFKGLISSYHLKTCIFFATEHFDNSFWVKENLLLSINNILQMVVDFLEKKYFPNYFIEKNNMVSHFTERQLNTLIEILKKLKSETGTNIWRSLNKIHQNNPYLDEDFYSSLIEKSTRALNNSRNWFFHQVWDDLRNDYKRLLNRNGDIVVDLHSKKNAFQKYMEEFSKINHYESSDIFLSLVVASQAHTFLCLYLATGNKEYKCKSEQLFRKKLLANSFLGKVQLSLFYRTTCAYEKTLETLKPFQETDMKLDRRNLKISNNLDIILIPEEMCLYKLMTIEEWINNTAWRFNPMMFANYLEIASLLKLSRSENAQAKMLQFENFLDDMTSENVDRISLDSGRYLIKLLKSLF